MTMPPWTGHADRPARPADPLAPASLSIHRTRVASAAIDWRVAETDLEKAAALEELGEAVDGLISLALAEADVQVHRAGRHAAARGRGVLEEGGNG